MTRIPDDRERRADKDRDQEERHEWRPARRPAVPTANWGLAFDLGLRLGLAIVIGLLLGLAVDNWLGTRPAFTLIGLVFGVAAAFYTIWDVAKKSMNR